jgi:hypothetical protein
LTSVVAKHLSEVRSPKPKARSPKRQHEEGASHSRWRFGLVSRFMRNKHDLGLSLASKIATVLGLRLMGGEGASASARPESGKPAPKGKGKKAKEE